MVFCTCKLSEMAFAAASSVVPDRAAEGEHGRELEANVLGVAECQGKMHFKFSFTSV